MPTDLVFGLRGPAGLGAGQTAQVKAEVVDIWGNKVVYYLNVTNALQNFTLSLTGDAKPPFFDRSHVTLINFVMDRVMSNNHYTDSFQVKTIGLIYQPSVDGTAYDASKFTDFDGVPVVSANGGHVDTGSKDGIVTLAQPSSTEFTVNYDVSPAKDSFVFAQMDFGAAGVAMDPSLIFALRGPAGLGAGQKAKVKAEVVDIWGSKAVYYLNVTNALQNFTLSLTGDAKPPFFDLAHVQYINFVMDEALSNNHYVDSFQVKTLGLMYAAVVNAEDYDATKHTVLPGYPSVSGTGGKVLAASKPGIITIDQSDSNGFAANYDVSPSADSFVFATVDFGSSGQALPSSLVLGVRGPSWNLTSRVKVEVMDIAGKKALFFLNTTKTLKNFTLNLSGDVLPAGFDLLHIGRINFVMDQTLSNAQFVNAFVVQTKGLLYTPKLTGTAYDASKHTTLPGSPLVTGAGGKVNATSLPGTITISQSASDGFAANYDVSPSADSFAFATIDFGTSGQALSSSVVLGLRGPSWGAAQMKVEFQDVNGKKAIFYVSTTTSLQNFTFDLVGDVLPAGFDLFHIQFINFVMDQNLSNWQFVNSFVVQTKGLLYAPVIDGTAYDATAHTTLPGSPGVSASGGKVNPGSLPGTVSLVQASPSEFTVNYDVSPSEDSFVFAQIDFGKAGKTLVQDLIFGLRGPAGLAAGQKAQVKVEVVDINNKRAYYYLNVTNAAQNFHLVLAGDPLPTGFDLAHVQFINFVIDQKLSNTKLKDSFKVNTKGLSFSGVVNGTAYDASKHTTLPGSPLPFVTGTGGKVEATSLPGTITIEQSASDGFAALYDVSKSPDSFVFGTIDLGSAGQALPTDLVLGLRGPSWNPISQVKVEVQDINGKKAVFYLNTTNALQNFTLNLSGDVLPSGFDLLHIQYIQFVMDQTLSNGQFVNSFVVQTKGLLYTPTLNGTAFDATVHTSLPGSPVVVATGGKVNPGSLPGVVTVDQGSTKDFTVNYDVSPSEDSFIFSQIAFDTAGVTLPSVLILGYQGPASGSSKVKVEVQDVNGKKAIFYLNATEAAKNYTLNLSGDVLPAGFDLTKVQYITFVMDRGLSNNHYTGSFKVYTSGLTYIARVAPLPAGDTSAITTLPLDYLGQRPALSPFASQDLSTATVTMQSQTQAQINLNLAAAGSFGGAYVSYDDFGTTGTVETADFSAAFPNGIVLELNNQFTSIPSVQFEVTDHTSSGDHKAVVILSGMAGTSQRWKILPSLLTGIDLTKVKSVALVVTGLQTNAILNVNWGNFAYTPSVTPDVSNPAVTLVPANYLGAKPVLNSFVSQGDIVNPDTSTVGIVQTSETFTTLSLNLKKDSSFGGMFINYNDPAATPPNSIDLSAAFPSGIVLGLDNAGTSLASVTFEVTDTSDKRDSVTLNGLTATEQKWKILASLFDEADIHHIKTLSLVVKGVNTNVKLNVDWGKFYVAPEVSPLPLTTTATITPVPVNSLGNPPALQSFALNDGSATSVDLSSASAGKINLNLVKTGSYGGVVVRYDNAATAGTVETIDVNALFPTGIVLQLDNGGTDVTSVKLELKDSNGVTGAVILKSIDATARKWKIMPSSFSNVDLAHVESIALTAVGQHINGILNLVWGNYEYTPPSGGGSSGP
jgi:hypothetical protein